MSPTQDMSISDFKAWMRDMKYADADIVSAIFGCSKGKIAETMRALAGMYSLALAPDDRGPPTADLIGKVQGDGDRDFGVIHFQAPGRVQSHACQPFPCDLLLSSPALPYDR